MGSHGSDAQTVMHNAVESALRTAGLNAYHDEVVAARDEFLDELGERGHLVRAAGRDSLDHITRAARRLLTHWDDCTPPADLTNYLAEPLEALRRLVDGRSTDEPTEADPYVDPPALDNYGRKAEKLAGWLTGMSQRRDAEFVQALADELDRLRAELDARQIVLDQNRAYYAEIERLRALVGGRSSAPGREPADRVDRHEAEAILAGLLDGTDHATCDSCRSVMRQAHALIVALLSRSAAEPTCNGGTGPHPFTPGIDEDNSDHPDPSWCNTCGEPRPKTGVAAGPQATPQVLWEGPLDDLVSQLDYGDIGPLLEAFRSRLPGLSVQVIAAPTSDQEPT